MVTSEKLLLDTHVLIWFQVGSSELGSNACSMILNPGNQILISPISTLEIAQLKWRGRIELSVSVEKWVREAFRALGAGTAPLTHRIASESYQLGEAIHSDPADRVLIATARSNKARLVTADRKILGGGLAATLDARE